MTSDDQPEESDGTICGAKTRNPETEHDRCQQPAGWGTEHPGEGRCKLHGGLSDGGAREGAGAPANNDNAEKHGMYADPGKYAERQEGGDKQWIRDVSAAICDRVRHNRGEVDKLDRVLARRIAVKLHIAARATEHVDKEGLMQTIEVQEGDAEYEKEIPHALLTELRNYDRETFNELKKLVGFDHGDDDSDTLQAEIKAVWIDDAE